MATTSGRVGDVFAVPVDAGRLAVGQIVAATRDGDCYVAIFGSDLQEQPPGGRALAALLHEPPVLLALALTGKLDRGDWPLLARDAVYVEVPFPAYKLHMGTPNNIEVIDYTGKRHRAATPAEAEALPYRKSVSPGFLEMVIRAWYGLSPWDPEYEEFRPTTKNSSAELFDDADGRDPVDPVDPESRGAVAATEDSGGGRHACSVQLHFKLSDDEHGTQEERGAIAELERQLTEAITAADVGEFDGDEFGGGEAVLWMFGPDKDRLWSAVEPLARQFPLRPAFALLVAEGDDVPTEQVHI